MDKTFYTEENPIRFPYAAKYKPTEKKLVGYYDIQDISAPTAICSNYDSSIKSIEVDGVLLDSVVTTYQFDSVGEHIIKYEFNNPTTVGNNAPLFYNIITIKRVVIPNTFTAISPNAFNCCFGLTSVTIPSSVTSIGYNAFSNCSALISVTIPSGVTSIGSAAFQGCSGLTSIDISDTVTSIDVSAFEYCTAIRELFYNAQCEINTSFRGWGNALEKVVIGDSTPSIGQGTFTGCSSLTSVTIGSGVTTIGSGVFYGCSSLTSIASLATTAPTINNNTFSNIETNGILTVPSGSSGYDVWMGTGDYYLGKYRWTKVEQ